jgi:hypothetical protein
MTRVRFSGTGAVARLPGGDDPAWKGEFRAGWFGCRSTQRMRLVAEQPAAGILDSGGDDQSGLKAHPRQTLRSRAQDERHAVAR